MIRSQIDERPLEAYSCMKQIVLIPSLRVDSIDCNCGLDQVVCLDRVQIYVEKDCVVFEEWKLNILLDISNAVKCQLNKNYLLKLNNSKDIPVVHHDGCHNLRQDPCVPQEWALRLKDWIRNEGAEHLWV